MPKIKLTIDGKPVEVEAGTTLLQAAETVGIQIPHYCYHPGLKLAGNCRMCLVEAEKMPKPLASCVAPVQEGMVVKTNTDNVISLRRSVMEFLLINHPLDCPTCDQAGECRLQDYYMQYDKIPSRFHEEKVHKDKMIDLGAGVMLDQERCIACTRCIRVCQEVAGVDELCLSNRGDHVTITTFPGKELSNPYAGNTVDVCPVGALTSKEFRFKKRVWFLESTSSVCPGCSRGCNITVQHQESKVYRLLPRLNSEVNSYWMCDEGRYGFDSVNDHRVLRARINEEGVSEEAGHEDALVELASLLRETSLSEIAVVGHASETCETLENLQQFAKNSLKSRYFFYSRFDPPHPYSDNILMTADKNANQKGVDQLGFKPLSDLKSAVGVLVLRDLTGQEMELLDRLQIPVLAFFAVNESPLCTKAKIVLPIPSYAEQEGHFINVQGKKQKIVPAFEPRGESRLVTEWLNDLKDLLESAGQKKKIAC